MKDDSKFSGKIIKAVQRLFLNMLKMSFLTWVFGNVLIKLGAIQSPTFLDWCIGTGTLIAAVGLRKKLVGKI